MFAILLDFFNPTQSYFISIVGALYCSLIEYSTVYQDCCRKRLFFFDEMKNYHWTCLEMHEDETFNHLKIHLSNCIKSFFSNFSLYDRVKYLTWKTVFDFFFQISDIYKASIVAEGRKKGEISYWKLQKLFLNAYF